MEILQKLRNDIFGVETKTSKGNIIANAFWGFWPSNEERYINPKMEDELVVFKKKIASRFEKKDIKVNFEFPRIGSQFHQKIQRQHKLVYPVEEEENNLGPPLARNQSQDRDASFNPALNTQLSKKPSNNSNSRYNSQPSRNA
jgi:hypothetical protein